MKILQRYTGKVLFECDADTMSEAVMVALMRGANLSCANLSGANLSGANLSYANLSYADLSDGEKIVSISGIGSCRRMTVYDCKRDIIWCGCFKGTIIEFEKEVRKTHAGNKEHLKDYLSAIQFLKSCAKSKEMK